MHIRERARDWVALSGARRHVRRSLMSRRDLEIWTVPSGARGIRINL
jgi:hypothetical protein